MEDAKLAVEEVADMEGAEDADGLEGVSSDIISKWIERYYEEKLDKTDRSKSPGAHSGKLKGLLAQQLYLN